MFVFLLGGFAPSYVPLRFVPVQDLFHLEVEGTVEKGQPLGQVLVHRRLADAELLCRGSDGCLVFQDVQSQVAGALFHISPQVLPLPTLSVSPLAGGNRSDQPQEYV